MPTPVRRRHGSGPAVGDNGHMHALITNDDGIDSPGLLPIAHAALEAGYTVLVAAPNKQYSGAGASLGGEPEESGFKVSDGRPPGLSSEIESVAVHASPALIAYGGVLEFFGPRPDVLLSGVNLGPNVGPAVVHSGTVGAALTAAAMRIPSLAASMSTMNPQRWDTAQDIISRVLPGVPSLPLDGRILNLNIPDLDMADVRGLRAGALGRYAEGVDEAADQVRMLLGGDAIINLLSQFEPGTDGVLLSQGWATLSLVQGPMHDDLDAGELLEFTL